MRIWGESIFVLFAKGFNHIATQRHGMNEMEGRKFADFPYEAGELVAFSFASDFFTVSTRNGHVIHYSPYDPALFYDWLMEHKVRNVKQRGPINRINDLAKKSKINVAIIDDFEPMRQGLREYLQRNGCSIAFEAENGLDCLEKLAASRILPDACILDVDMPKMNGFDTLREIKKYWPHIRVVMFSMRTDVYSVRKAKENGADAFLGKECHPDELLAAIHEG